LKISETDDSEANSLGETTVPAAMTPALLKKSLLFMVLIIWLLKIIV